MTLVQNVHYFSFYFFRQDLYDFVDFFVALSASACPLSRPQARRARMKLVENNQPSAEVKRGVLA
jgi:hypothetical protein